MLCEDGVRRPDAIEVGEVIKNHAHEFIESGKMIGKNGLTAGTGGNMSIKVPGGMLITRTGAKLSELKQDDIVFVAAVDGDNIYYVGQKKPSVETIMHWMIYQGRPEIGAISHVNAGPKDDKEIMTSNEEIAWGTRELGVDTANMFTNADVAMMKNHGVVAVSSSLKKATEIVVDYADNKKLYIFT
jgi:L-fuculose-phosphate aldolase